jgi:endonuclease/exonuclease/phosphatase family metal-dependent hydrolase
LKRLVYKFALYFNILLAVFLVLSHLSVLISPEKIWHFAFLGLAYPYLLAANVFMILFWLLFRKKELLISLIAIITGWNILTSIVQLNFKFLKEKEIKEKYTRNYRSENKTIKILAYNVRAFNIYDWTRFKGVKDSILRFINDEDPDIICFQEYYTQEKGVFSTKDLYKSLKNTPYRHVYYTIGEGQNSNYGIATFSSYPVVGKGVIRFENSFNISIYTDINFNGDTIRIFNNHLQSVHLNIQNYAFLDSLKLRYNDQQLNEILDISYRLKDAFIKRAQQADMISKKISESPYPVIICGDFNDTPVSYTYKKIKSSLSDSFIEAGSGIGSTYAGIFPSFRIDYILHQSNMNALYTERVRLKLSDHYPILTYLRFD